MKFQMGRPTDLRSTGCAGFDQERSADVLAPDGIEYAAERR